MESESKSERDSQVSLQASEIERVDRAGTTGEFLMG